MTSTVSARWNETEVLYRVPVYVNQTGTSTLTNIPINLSLNTQSLISAGKLDSSCYCIWFRDNADTGFLDWHPYNITSSSYGCNSANTPVFVEVDSLPSSNTSIWLYYTPDCGASSGSWSESATYDQYYRLSTYWNNESGSYLYDYTGRTVKGTVSDMLWNSNGFIGYDGYFDGSNDYVDYGAGVLLLNTSLTFEVWAKTSQTAYFNLVANSKAGTYTYALSTDAGSKPRAIIHQCGGGTYMTTGSGTCPAINDSKWHHIVFRFVETPSKELAVFVDGVKCATDTTSSGSKCTHPASELRLGMRFDGDGKYNGYLDGYRFAYINRSDDYIKRQAQNDLAFFGSEQKANEPPTTTLISPINGTRVPNGQVTFNITCTDADNNCANISLYGTWGGWHLNETKDATGGWNFSIFTKNIEPNGTYLWTAKSMDQKSLTDFADVNFTLYIGNIIPRIASAELYPASPTEIDDLYINITCEEDDESDNIYAFWKTWKDDARQDSLSEYGGYLVSNDTDTTVFTIDATNTSPSEVWKVETWCGDGYYNTTPLNTSSRTILAVPPTLDFVAPTLANNSYTNVSTAYINVSANKLLSTCILEWEGVNETFSVMGTDWCYIEKNGLLADNSYYYRVWVNSTFDKWNKTSDRQINIDDTPPTPYYISPTLATGSVTPSRTIDINVSANELLDYCLLDWYNNTWQNITMPVSSSGSYCDYTVSKYMFPNKEYRHKVWTRDLAGNWNSTYQRFVNRSLLNLTMWFDENNTYVQGEYHHTRIRGTSASFFGYVDIQKAWRYDVAGWSPNFVTMGLNGISWNEHVNGHNQYFQDQGYCEDRTIVTNTTDYVVVVIGRCHMGDGVDKSVVLTQNFTFWKDKPYYMTNTTRYHNTSSNVKADGDENFHNLMLGAFDRATMLNGSGDVWTKTTMVGVALILPPDYINATCVGGYNAYPIRVIRKGQKTYAHFQSAWHSTGNYGMGMIVPEVGSNSTDPIDFLAYMYATTNQFWEQSIEFAYNTSDPQERFCFRQYNETWTNADTMDYAVVYQMPHYGNYTAVMEIADGLVPDDYTPPTLTIYSPKAVTYEILTIWLNASADEVIDTWWVSVNGGTNTTFTPNATTFIGQEGSNNVIIYASDLSGNENSVEINFTIQTIPTGFEGLLVVTGSGVAGFLTGITDPVVTFILALSIIVIILAIIFVFSSSIKNVFGRISF